MFGVGLSGGGGHELVGNQGPFREAGANARTLSRVPRQPDDEWSSGIAQRLRHVHRAHRNNQLADCSSGIEHFFALSYRREVIGTTKIIDVHPELAVMLQAEVSDPGPLLKQVRATGRLPGNAAPELRSLLATAHEIAPEWHVRMQGAFQRHTDTAVCKTINLVNGARPNDIAAAAF